MTPPPKPRFRGTSHAIACGIAAVAGAFLVTIPQSVQATWSAAIYALSLVMMFGISAIYHVPMWEPGVRQWLKRLDHAAIFLLIAGTMTPVAVLALGEQGPMLMWGVWTGAFLGIGQAFFWVRAPKWVTAVLYLALGWMAAPYFPEMQVALGNLGVWLIMAGGILYSLGAVVYALHYPNPWPKTFGYHEIFHLFVVLASICHFVAIFNLLAG